MIEQGITAPAKGMSKKSFRKLKQRINDYFQLLNNETKVNSTDPHLAPLQLNFPKNGFYSAQVSELAHMLAYIEELKHLSIKIPSEGLTEQQEKNLACILTAAKQITIISLANAAEATKKAFASLSKALYKNTNVHTLILEGFINVRISIEELGNLLKNNKTITALNLSACLLKDEHVLKIIHSLKDNTTLINLILNHNDIEILGAIALISGSLPHLKLLHLVANRLPSGDISGLCDAIKMNKTIQNIDLSHSDWDEDAFEKFARCFCVKMLLRNYDGYFSLSLSKYDTKLEIKFFFQISPQIYYGQKVAGKAPLERYPKMYVENQVFLPISFLSKTDETKLDIVEYIITHLVHFDENSHEFMKIQKYILENPDLCLLVFVSLTEFYGYYHHPKREVDEKHISDLKMEDIPNPMSLDESNDQEFNNSIEQLGVRLFEFATLILKAYQRVPDNNDKLCETRQSVLNTVSQHLPRLHDFTKRCRENQEFKDLINSFYPGLIQRLENYRDFKPLTMDTTERTEKRQSSTIISKLFADTSKSSKKTKTNTEETSQKVEPHQKMMDLGS